VNRPMPGPAHHEAVTVSELNTIFIFSPYFFAFSLRFLRIL
jgi:hypothetical protein